MSRCLSPHLANIGTASRPVSTIHLHSDGKWWCWNGPVEQGPFDTQELAEEAWQSVAGHIKKQQPPHPPVSNAIFYKQVLHEVLMAFLAVFIAWLIRHNQ